MNEGINFAFGGWCFEGGILLSGHFIALHIDTFFPVSVRSKSVFDSVDERPFLSFHALKIRKV